ncbi:MAG: DUF5688 family protein [Lachnospiraceae bacterium]|nr:DUF5688 family protein [Lachnospiraceae bacterium]
MDYKTFKEKFTEDLKEKLYENGIEDVEMSLRNVEKTNLSYESLTIVPRESNVGINFNIEQAFSDYEYTEDYESILVSSTHAIMRGLENVPSVDVAELTSYEAMKDKLSIEVISAEANADLLDKIPHENMEDMAVVYRFVLESNEIGRSSILVTNDMIERMGVTHDQLKADALENAPEIRPAVIHGMSEVVKEMMGEEAFELAGLPDVQDEAMYVATVPDKTSGAGVIAYQDFMDQAAEKLGGDFYILPSSIHEILLVPDNGEMAADQLRDMVKEVNATQVSPEEKLTDNVYHYDSREHIFELAEKFEARQKEQDVSLDEKTEEHGSVLKDLKDKQKEVAAKPPVKDAAEKLQKQRVEKPSK